MKILPLLCTAALCAGAQAGAQTALYPAEFPLRDVELLDSTFSHAMELNTGVLLQYDTDRLLAPYLKAAGLEPRGESFACWDGLDGHVGGHYLSALAIHWAATGDERLKERLDYVLDELSRCAAARPDGYLGGVPGGDELWHEVARGNVQRVYDWWVPWYNVHKMYAGLRDAYIYAGSRRALEMFLSFCDWGVREIENLDDAAMEKMLGNEHGGMNEMFADAYALTGAPRYLDAARRFTHHELFDALATGRDNLDNKHANTQVPKVVGFQRVAAVSGDTLYGNAARFFWDTVTGGRSLSFGGNSRREHFAPAADARSYVEEREGPETCNTNNMLRLTEALFFEHPHSRLADFYERALYNHILSSQHPGHGGYVYFTPARPGHYRVYSRPNMAMWCCVGTGMENHGKYGQFIYTRNTNSACNTSSARNLNSTHTSGRNVGAAPLDDTLRVNLFIPSRLTWRDKGVTVTQQGGFPREPRTTLTVNAAGGRPVPFTLMVRKPSWCDAPVLLLNGKQVDCTPGDDGYYALTRQWNDGDTLAVELPMHFAVEPLNHLPGYVSITHGPVVLASRHHGPEELPGLVAGEERWGHIAHGPLVSVFDTPVIIGDSEELPARLEAMEPSTDKPGAYIARGIFDGDAPVLLEPFSGIHDSRYTVYWLQMSPGQWEAYRERMRRDEALGMELDARTVDAVICGEQQPEADHYISQRNTSTGNSDGAAWRAAWRDGHFGYRLVTGGHGELTLRVRYRRDDREHHRFDILVDGELLATVDNTPTGESELVDSEFTIPAAMLKGKSSITVDFKPNNAHSTGPVCHLRLLK